jgi:hypothetical protein
VNVFSECEKVDKKMRKTKIERVTSRKGVKFESKSGVIPETMTLVHVKKQQCFHKKIKINVKGKVKEKPQ